ncbi:AMP-binding protein [Xanthobacter dioxanivorans]|uniref:AMP-binding protein n=1 Tax=Xanthobacter dioxanivorans TaxID=2528964 RepID=A0A974SGU9_9HYPH|nr:AMP-binding protein [Xanthobacter dioxanivorans]QRG05651.1 AMP-binding protein [Xanthobacter dioxanivorans]
MIAPDPADASVTFGARLRGHARARGSATAITVLSPDGTAQPIGWEALDRLVDRIAGALMGRGLGQGSVVGIGLPNGLAHIALVLGVWRMGGTVLAFDHRQPAAILAGMWDRAKAALVVVPPAVVPEDHRVAPLPGFWEDVANRAEAVVPDQVSRPGKILLSGGSTGVSKLMADDLPWRFVPGRPWGDVAPALGFRADQVQLVAGAMSHNAPLTWAQMGLFEGHHLVVLEAFGANLALDAIDRFGVGFAMVVPTMMVRMLDADARRPRSLASLEALYHTGAPCPGWLKAAWIERLGPARVTEMYGSGENVGQTIITGTEWLGHRGSVGRPFQSAARIYAAAGALLPAGEVGELFMRRDGHVAPEARVRYLDPGVASREDADGFVSVGDMAFVDGDGYVHLAGRRDDVINSGGVKVHPEKVEAAVLSCPGVRDVVAVGLDDRDWGQRVHVVIEPADPAAPVTLADVRRHCAGLLAADELPKSLSVVAALPRDGFGKVKRRMVQAAEEQHTG